MKDLVQIFSQTPRLRNLGLPSEEEPVIEHKAIMSLADLVGATNKSRPVGTPYNPGPGQRKRREEVKQFVERLDPDIQDAIKLMKQRRKLLTPK